MTTTESEYDAIVDKIRSWPVARRFALLHEVLHMLAAETAAGNRQSLPPRRSTLAQAIGLFKTDGPPPTDEQVRQLLDERRIERFG
jgi:hypothetical protein